MKHLPGKFTCQGTNSSIYKVIKVENVSSIFSKYNDIKVKIIYKKEIKGDRVSRAFALHPANPDLIPSHPRVIS